MCCSVVSMFFELLLALQCCNGSSSSCVYHLNSFQRCVLKFVGSTKSSWVSKQNDDDLKCQRHKVSLNKVTFPCPHVPYPWLNANTFTAYMIKTILNGLWRRAPDTWAFPHPNPTSQVLEIANVQSDVFVSDVTSCLFIMGAVDRVWQCQGFQGLKHMEMARSSHGWHCMQDISITVSSSKITAAWNSSPKEIPLLRQVNLSPHSAEYNKPTSSFSCVW